MRLRTTGLLLTAAVIIVALAAGLARSSRVPAAQLKQQVEAAERAFAATMRARDFDAFASHLSREAVFMDGQGAQRGKEAVATAWRPFFDKPDAPFSWEPDSVEVLDSGTLAFSSGPIRDPAGREIGRFHSVWRLEGPNSWRIVFDRGCACRIKSA